MKFYHVFIAILFSFFLTGIILFIGQHSQPFGVYGWPLIYQDGAFSIMDMRIYCLDIFIWFLIFAFLLFAIIIIIKKLIKK